MTTRLGIYVYWDAEGILKGFAREFLIQLCKICQDVLVVVNGDLEEESCEFIVSIGCKYIRRSNKGYDFGAYQAGLQYVGWNQLQSYDGVGFM